MRPVTMSGMSTRLIGLPAIFQSFGSLSATSFGGASFAASPATLPKLVLRPLGPCVITPLGAVHSAAGTSHTLAPAAISISRAPAPALRRESCDWRDVRLAHPAKSAHE